MCEFVCVCVCVFVHCANVRLYVCDCVSICADRV